MKIDTNSLAKLAFDCEMNHIEFDFSDNETITIVMFDNNGNEYAFDDIDECESFLLENISFSHEIVKNIFIITSFVYDNDTNILYIYKDYTNNKIIRNSITKEVIEFDKTCMISEEYGQLELFDVNNDISIFQLEQKQNTFYKISE